VTAHEPSRKRWKCSGGPWQHKIKAMNDPPLRGSGEVLKISVNRKEPCSSTLLHKEECCPSCGVGVAYTYNILCCRGGFITFMRDTSPMHLFSYECDLGRCLMDEVVCFEGREVVGGEFRWIR
jgi:hypothetical protein